MERPQSVNQAIIAIWATLALSAIASLVNRWLGHVGMGEFVFAILIYGLMCVFPYKIGNGSNAARYIYAVIMAITFLLMLGGTGSEIPRLDYILSILLIPVELFILYRLFQRESSSWFSFNKTQANQRF